jgi:peroxiredoxin Q/BCP
VRDALAQFDTLRTDAVGISPDSVEAQRKFHEKLHLNFPLLSDSDHAIADAYGVWGEKRLYGKKYFGIIRSSFLIDENGRLIDAWYAVSPDETVPNALAALGAA